MIFVTLAKHVDALKHVGVLTLYKILLIYIYIYCAIVGLDKPWTREHAC
jgi:hypothetical protein